jgi:peptidoglycan glycosyltransferase
MIKELNRVSLGIGLLFGALFVSATVIQVFQVDNLRVDPRNVRTVYDSYATERGSILVGSTLIAESVPADDVYRYQRIYHGGGLYAPITGYYTINQGITGLEFAMNDKLSGQSNSQFFDQVMALVSGTDPRGASVKLTVNAAVQQAARDAMGELTGAAIAIEPSTGRILALVSTPSFDPNDLTSHDNEVVLSKYTSLVNSGSQPLINRAIAGDLYHPGSVFKLVVAAAALDSGIMSEQSTVPNPAKLKLPLSDSSIRNWSGNSCGPEESVTIATALRFSCNIPFAEIGAQVGESRIHDYAQAFGFGATVEIPMAVTPSTFPSGMDEAQLMLSAFGQFDVRVTPLQIAMISSAIANGGVLMSPTIVDSVLARDLSPLAPFTPVEYSTPISPETASVLRDMMVAGVSDGVASGARIRGVSVAGKTGTAENGKGQPYTLWFTGFAPAENPRVAVVVVVENGGGVGQSASGNSLVAPIARKIMEAVLAQ